MRQSPHRLFFYLTILLLPTQLGYHFWPEWAMVLGRRVDYLSPTIYLTDVLIILLLLSWFSFRDLRKFVISNFQFLIKFQFQKLLMAFFILLFIFINIFVSLNQPAAIYKWIRVLEFGLFAYYIVKTKPNPSRITLFLSLAVFYSSLIAIGQFVLQHSVGGLLWFFGERTFGVDTPGIARMSLFGREILRSYATFPHPNVLGGFLAVTLPMISSPAILLFGLVALALTFSRSAILVAVLALWKKTRLLSLFVLLLLLIIKPSFQDESFIVRNELNTAAIRIWQSSPFFGVGHGNFLVALPSFLPSREIYFLQPVHNIYLLFLSEVGLVGAGLIIFSIFISRKLFTVHSPLFTLLLLGFVDHYPLTLQQGQLILALLVGLSFSHSSSPSDRINT